MKKITSLLAVLPILVSCGGSSNTNNQNTPEEQPKQETSATNITSPSYNIAYEAAMKINAENKKFPSVDTSDQTKAVFTGLTSEEFDLDKSTTAIYQNISSGGYLIVYQTEESGVLGDGFIESIKEFKVFSYKDGVLTEKNDLLPKPSFKDFSSADELLVANTENDFSNNLKNGYNYRISGDKILAGFEEYAWIEYAWDGSKFVINGSPKNCSMSVLSGEGLASLKLGGLVPETLGGFDKKQNGNNVVFSQKGEKAFQLALSKDNKIDTITVFSPKYTYSLCCTGGCVNFGVGYSPTYDVMDCKYQFNPDQADDYYVCKDGVFVRTMEFENGVIEFYGSKSTVTNLKYDIGKRITMADKPKFAEYDKDPVKLIKLYAKGGFCQSCEKMSDKEKTDKIREMYNSVALDKNLKKKNAETQDEESGYIVEYNYYYQDDHLVMVECSWGDSWMQNYKLYLRDNCLYFCLIHHNYPDNTEAFERYYLCNDKIFKAIDKDKKETINPKDEYITDLKKRMTEILSEALKLEEKAK